MVGTEDVDCDTIDLTYVRSRTHTRLHAPLQLRICSTSLAACVRDEAQAFSAALARHATADVVQQHRMCVVACAYMHSQTRVKVAAGVHEYALGHRPFHT